MTFSVSKTVSDETLSCIIQIESGGRPTAKAPTSSALGLGQFLNGTWLAVVEKHRPDVMAGKSAPEVLAMRTDTHFCVEMLARFTEDNQHIVGMNCTGGDLYLAHFLGSGAAMKVYRGHPDDPVEPLVGEKAVAANRSILAGKTCAQVRAWAAHRMAQSDGHRWVEKYWQPPPAPAEDEQAPAEAPEDTAQDAEQDAVDDVPDPQAAPDVPARRDPVPPVTAPVSVPPKDKTQLTPGKSEGFVDWMKRKAKTVSSVIGGGSLGLGSLSYFSDWRIAAVLMGGVIVSGTIIGIFYLLSRPKT